MTGKEEPELNPYASPEPESNEQDGNSSTGVPAILSLVSFVVGMSVGTGIPLLLVTNLTSLPMIPGSWMFITVVVSSLVAGGFVTVWIRDQIVAAFVEPVVTEKDT